MKEFLLDTGDGTAVGVGRDMVGEIHLSIDDAYGRVRVTPNEARQIAAALIAAAEEAENKS